MIYWKVKSILMNPSFTSTPSPWYPHYRSQQEKDIGQEFKLSLIYDYSSFISSISMTKTLFLCHPSPTLSSTFLLSFLSYHFIKQFLKIKTAKCIFPLHCQRNSCVSILISVNFLNAGGIKLLHYWEKKKNLLRITNILFNLKAKMFATANNIKFVWLCLYLILH